MNKTNLKMLLTLSHLAAVARAGDAAELVELLEPLTSTAAARLEVAEALADLLAQGDDLPSDVCSLVGAARVVYDSSGAAGLAELLEHYAATAVARRELAGTLIRLARGHQRLVMFGALPSPDSPDGEFIRAALADDFDVAEPYVVRMAEPDARAAIVEMLREHGDAMAGMFRGRGIGPGRLPEHPKMDDFLEAAAGCDFEAVDEGLAELEHDRTWRLALFQIARLGLDSIVMLRGLDRSELAAHFGVLLEDLAESSAGVAPAEGG